MTMRSAASYGMTSRGVSQLNLDVLTMPNRRNALGTPCKITPYKQAEKAIMLAAVLAALWIGMTETSSIFIMIRYFHCIMY